MYCSNCGNPHSPEDRFCRFCGNPLNAPPKPRVGSLWVPIVTMALLFAIGIGLFFAIPYGSGSTPASQTASVESDYFSVRGGVLHFNKDAYGGGSELIVPDTVNGSRITAISDGCFEKCTFLTSVTLPNTIETIGKNAFRGCSALRGIEIPKSVRRIEAEAFYDCTALEAICVSDTLEYVGPGAFSGCDKLYYIMFLGEHQDWVDLYDEYITPYTGVFCDDGSFYQGKPAS